MEQYRIAEQSITTRSFSEVDPVPLPARFTDSYTHCSEPTPRKSISKESPAIGGWLRCQWMP